MKRVSLIILVLNQSSDCCYCDLVCLFAYHLNSFFRSFAAWLDKWRCRVEKRGILGLMSL